MSRNTMLLLAAGAVAGGCSRDAPLAPEAEAVPAIAAAAPAIVAPSVAIRADAVNDALLRLLPALDQYGSSLRGTLLQLKLERSDHVARHELRGVLDRLASNLPPEYRADFDALRLELDAAIN